MIRSMLPFMQDRTFTGLVAQFSDACDLEDDERAAELEYTLLRFGATMDDSGAWRHPDDRDPRDLDEIMAGLGG